MTEHIPERRIDRTGWPSGPWDDEPDRWEDRHCGLPVLAVRNWMGVWCGYVGVPPGHRWHNAGHSPVDDEVRVHGGLTYGDFCRGSICHVPRPGEPAEVYWLGFDCGHSGDLTPSCYSHPYPGDVYRTLTYVQDQVRGLAEQVAAQAI